MGRTDLSSISDANLLNITKSETTYEGKKIGKWWGKTLFHYNNAENKVFYETFSPVKLLFHFFGYKKEYTDDGLKKWLKKVDPVKYARIGLATETVFSSPSKIENFKKQCNNWDFSETDVIESFKNLDPSTLVDKKLNISALLYAVRHGRFEVAKHLINDGADINLSACDNSYRLTPLQETFDAMYHPISSCSKFFNVHDSAKEFFMLLLNKGADVNAKDCYGDNTLQIVIHELKKTIDELKDKEKPINETEKQNKETKIKELKEIITILIDKKVDVNHSGNSYNGKGTPLALACLTQDVELIEQLIKSGANVNPINGTKPPIFSAIGTGNIEIVKFLISKGADLNIPKPAPSSSIIWPTSLTVATYNNDQPMVEFLLEQKGDINKKGGIYEETPLHIAVSKGNADMVKLLLKNGADPSITNSLGKKPSETSEIKNRQDIIKLFPDAEKK